jgi:hypothetical protein
MTYRGLVWSGAGLVGTAGGIGGAWMLSLPPTPPFVPPLPIEKSEADAMLASLKPPKRQRPVIAIVGINDAPSAAR